MENKEFYNAKYIYKNEISRSYVDQRKDEIVWEIEENIIKKIISGIPEGNSVMDVPFGTGRFGKIYANAGLITYGVDISKEMLDESISLLGKNLTNINIICGDAERLCFHDNSIDYIFCIRLFHLIPTKIAEKILDEFFRIARKKVIIQVFNVKDMQLKGMIYRMISFFLHKPFSIFSFIKRLGRRFLRLKSKKEANKFDGIQCFSHNNSQLHDIFNKSGFKISEIITIDELYSRLDWIFYPSKLYILSKNDR